MPVDTRNKKPAVSFLAFKMYCSRLAFIMPAQEKNTPGGDLFKYKWCTSWTPKWIKTISYNFDLKCSETDLLSVGPRAGFEITSGLNLRSLTKTFDSAFFRLFIQIRIIHKKHFFNSLPPS